MKESNFQLGHEGFKCTQFTNGHLILRGNTLLREPSLLKEPRMHVIVKPLYKSDFTCKK